MRAGKDTAGALSFVVVAHPGTPEGVSLPGDGPTPAFVVALGDGVGDPRLARECRVPLHALPGNGVPGRRGPIGFERDGVHIHLLDTALPVGRGGRVGGAQIEELSKGLRRVGFERPVVLATVHPLDDLDDPGALLDAVAPYNVRLIVSAGDDRTVEGSANAIPTASVRRGGKLIVSVGPGGVDARDGAFRLHAPARRPRRPRWKVLVSARGGDAEVRVERGSLPQGSHLTARADGPPLTLTPTDAGWSGRLDIAGLPGVVAVHVNAHLPGGPDWRQDLSLRLTGSHALAPIWAGDVGDGALGSLRIDGPRVLVPTVDGALVALDRRSGQRLWRFPGSGAPLVGVALAEGLVLCVAADGLVHALRSGDGTVSWRRDLGAAAGGIALEDGMAAVTAGGAVHGLSQIGGAARWKTPLEGVAGSALSAAAGRYLVGTDRGVLHACDARSGRLLWETPLGVDPSRGASPASRCAPAVDGDLVLALSATGLLRAVRAATGELRWSAPTGAPELASVWFSESGGLLGSARADGAVVGCDRRDGRVLWRTPTGAAAVPSPGAACDGVAVVGSADGVLWAVQSGQGARFGPGSLLWRYRVGSGMLAMPAALDGVVYAGARDGAVVALPIVPPHLSRETDR